MTLCKFENNMNLSMGMRISRIVNENILEKQTIRGEERKR